MCGSDLSQHTVPDVLVQWEWVKRAVKPLPGCPSASFWSLTSLGLDVMGFCCAQDLYLGSSLVSSDAAAILQEEQTKKPCRKFLQTGEEF